MNQPLIALSRRLRHTIFADMHQGVKAYTIYNHMRLPSVFESLVDDYHHLKSKVQIWDVSCERQVQLQGPDAAKLAQWMTPRNLGRLRPGVCYYAPLVNAQGGMINDPVVMKLADDCFWFSIADSDVLLWAMGLAHGASLDVEVSEPDVSPLAIQGPFAQDLMVRVFGDAIYDIGFFAYKAFSYHGYKLNIARSGYSKQGGYEIYVTPGKIGPQLWQDFFQQGDGMDLRSGGPNLIERIEAGLLSYGNDMTLADNPFECGLAKYCQIDGDHDFIGKTALQKIKQDGPTRMIRSFALDGEAVPLCDVPWPIMAPDQNVQIGQITSCVYSPDFATNVGLGMVNATHWDDGTPVVVCTPNGDRLATVRIHPFL